jgi:hypothetical protein
MASKAFSTLVPRVLPYATACPKETVRQHIRDAAIVACEQTLAWRYEIRRFNLVAGVHEYAYSKPADADVHALFGAVLGETTPLAHLTLEQAIERFPAWADMLGGVDPLSAWSLTPPSQFNTDEFNALTFGGNPAFVTPENALEGASQPQVITQITPDKFVVLPVPDATYELRMFLALKPRRSATAMDDVVFEELEDAIFHRAIYTLTLMPNKPWSSAEQAAYHRREARFLTSERRARANLTNGRGSVRVAYPGFE